MQISRCFSWSRQVLGAFLVKIAEPFLYGLAFLWRRALVSTKFILITGSLGKTTTKECLSEILAVRFPTFRSVRNQNARRLLSLNVLRVRPWHRFAVIETATFKPGVMAKAANLLRPDVAVIVSVAGTHLHGFGSIEEIAKEKMSALGGLRKGGAAILNGDEPRLSLSSSENTFQTLKFGTSHSCDLHADNITSRWPDRLNFRASSASDTVEFKTQMVGTHWIPSILASLLTAEYCGVPLSEAAEMTPRFLPFTARMQPVRLPSGAVFIRDEYNGSPWSFETALEAFELAEAQRKILITGDYSDSTVRRRRRLARLGRRAAGLCNLAVFVGEHSHHSQQAAVRAGLTSSTALNFAQPKDASDFLKGELRDGDLVLLKSRANDHLSRLLFAQVGEVLCWRPTCPERLLCDICWRLGCRPSDMAKIEPV